MNLKPNLIGINGLNINQINTLQTTLDLKAPQLTTYTKLENDTLLNLKQPNIGINGLNINQINTLQTTLDLKALQSTTYTKTEGDAKLLLKVTETDLDNSLSTLTAKIGGTPSGNATMTIKGDTVLNTLILESSKGTH